MIVGRWQDHLLQQGKWTWSIETQRGMPGTAINSNSCSFLGVV